MNIHNVNRSLITTRATTIDNISSHSHALTLLHTAHNTHFSRQLFYHFDFIVCCPLACSVSIWQPPPTHSARFVLVFLSFSFRCFCFCFCFVLGLFCFGFWFYFSLRLPASSWSVHVRSFVCSHSSGVSSAKKSNSCHSIHTHAHTTHPHTHTHVCIYLVFSQANLWLIVAFARVLQHVEILLRVPF